jgi:hypothetical protein
MAGREVAVGGERVKKAHGLALNQKFTAVLAGGLILRAALRQKPESSRYRLPIGPGETF